MLGFAHVDSSRTDISLDSFGSMKSLHHIYPEGLFKVSVKLEIL